MKPFLGVPVLAVAVYFFVPSASEAPTGFDNKSNGMVADATHAVDQGKFDEILTASVRFTTRSPAASAIRTQLPVPQARFQSCASATADPRESLKIRIFRTLAARR
jgi:hypothetical protein